MPIGDWVTSFVVLDHGGKVTASQQSMARQPGRVLTRSVARGDAGSRPPDTTFGGLALFEQFGLAPNGVIRHVAPGPAQARTAVKNFHSTTTLSVIFRTKGTREGHQLQKRPPKCLERPVRKGPRSWGIEVAFCVLNT
jgi:hypothetical protein